MQLKHKRIIVTGGARGIGAVTVGALVAEGAAVVSLDIIDGRPVTEASNATGPGSASFHRCDIALRTDVETAFAAVAEKMGGLDGVVNAAGIEDHGAPEDITDAQWARMMAVNVTGTFLTNQAAFRYMREHGGRILNFGSDAGLLGYPSAAHYSASKGAVISWSRSAASAWGRYNIAVNALVPAMWTPMYDEHRATFTPEQLQAHDAMMAQAVSLGGRLGDTLRDLAPVIIFLLSDGARFITGQIISVNGGLNGTR